MLHVVRSLIIRGMDSVLAPMRSLLAVSLGFGEVFLVVLLVAGIAVCLLSFRQRNRMQPRSGYESWEVLLRAVCAEARTAVDELLPQRSTAELPNTAGLTAIAARLRGLDAPLGRLVGKAPSRAAEAAEEIGQVSAALQAALLAERSRRVTIDRGSLDKPTRSIQLVIDRAIELEMAIQAALRLADTR